MQQSTEAAVSSIKESDTLVFYSPCLRETHYIVPVYSIIAIISHFRVKSTLFLV